MSHFNQIANSWDTPDKIILNNKYALTIMRHIESKKPLNILEVGCGTGLLGSVFINGNNRLLGIDTSKGMLDIFEQKFSGNKNVQSKLLNLEESELSEKNFDLIISSMAFHHLIDPANMILKLKNLLSPDGIIAIIDLDQEDGTFHPDPKAMGVHHFGFSIEKNKEWGKKAEMKVKSREIIHTIQKESGNFPIFLLILEM